MVVVGGSTGVGAALVRALAAEGARCTVLALPGEELDQVVAEVGGAEVPLDLADFDQVDGAIGRAEALNGPVDVLMCNAAVSPAGPFQDFGARQLWHATTVNMLSQMELIRQVIPGMRARGRGTITTTGSLSTEVSMIHLGAYVPGKAGLTKCALDLQSELRDYGIRVFTFILGSVKGTTLANKAIEDPVVDFIERRAGDAGVLTPEVVAKRMVEVVGSDRKSALITVPKAASPLVGFRNLAVKLIDPVMGRPARKFKRQAHR
ncbi:SDR family oxidoreductase [Pseudonocardia eucalypti]|uniref:SDR family oxidoreductase n=1 Tax=Pseudonocardia eucalypti TaxID=648755 RepID=A0ABP9QJ78_9PSEU